MSDIAVPHLVEFEPQLREAFLAVEGFLHALQQDALTAPGIHWWDGSVDPNTGGPAGARGGDIYVHTVTGDIYRYVSDPYTRSLTGTEDESRATDGSMWWDGTVDPTSTATPYRIQDYWLNVTSCDIWALR